MQKTVSVCPVCLKRIPAVRVKRDGRFYQEKSCPEHGAFSTLIWQGSEDLEGWTGPPGGDRSGGGPAVSRGLRPVRKTPAKHLLHPFGGDGPV